MYLVFQICFYTLPLTVVCYETDRGPEDVGLGEDRREDRPRRASVRCRYQIPVLKGRSLAVVQGGGGGGMMEWDWEGAC